MIKWPYKNCKLYKLFNKQTGRFILHIYKSNKERTTISLAKFNLQNKLGRPLKRFEEADHIDDNKLNDNPDNLQPLTRLENQRKFSKGEVICWEICDFCGTRFSRSRRAKAAAKGYKRAFCNRTCMGKAFFGPRDDSHGGLINRLTLD